MRIPWTRYRYRPPTRVDEIVFTAAKRDPWGMRLVLLNRMGNDSHLVLCVVKAGFFAILILLAERYSSALDTRNLLVILVFMLWIAGLVSSGLSVLSYVGEFLLPYLWNWNRILLVAGRSDTWAQFETRLEMKGLTKGGVSRRASTGQPPAVPEVAPVIYDQRGRPTSFEGHLAQHMRANSSTKLRAMIADATLAEGARQAAAAELRSRAPVK